MRKGKDEGGSISADTYLALRAGILSGGIAPGIKVTTPELCKAFDASPGAVREALSRLRAEGLINAEVHRGFSVTPISIDDLRDLTEVRINVETNCLARSIVRGGDEWEANLIASAHLLAKAHKGHSIDHEPSNAFVDVHRAFHEALVSACDSPRLLRLRQQLFDESERYRVLNNIIEPDRDTAKEHHQIADATIERNTQLAQALLASHIARTTATIVQAMTQRAGSPSVSAPVATD